MSPPTPTASSHSVAVEPVGLTVLYEPSNPGETRLDIVLVHGFNGHPERTWTYKGDDIDSPVDEVDPAEHSSQPPAEYRKLNFTSNGRQKKPPRSEICWPRQLLPQTVPDARIMTFGYDTKVHHVLKSLRSQNTVYDHALELLNCLSDVRQSKPESARPMLFIAHSLGGIVDKEALRQSKGFAKNWANGRLLATFQSTIGVFFLGTPHRGADPRGFLANIAERVARAAGFTVNQKICETLLPSSERLRELQDEFPAMIEEQRWRIVSFRETVGMKIFDGKKVVDKTSACIGNRNLEIVRDIEGDHRAICRFRGLEDAQYRKLASELTHVIQHLQKETPEREEIREDEHLSLELATGFVTEVTLTMEQREELLDLLYFDQIDARLMSLKKAQAKTCRWLLKAPQYREWLSKDRLRHNGFFWIKGKPGTGKSVMMKFLFSEAQRASVSTKQALVSFFFNARGHDLEKSTLGLYRSLLLQLLQEFPELRSVVDHCGPMGYEAIKRSGWQRETLQKTLALLIDRLQGQQDHVLCCYIDALDECPEEDIRDMIFFLEEICSEDRSGQFRVCFSSRHYPEIGIRTSLQLILEDELEHTKDISLYIDTHLLVGNTSEAEEIKQEVLRKSSNIFLWVVLVILILNKEYDRGRTKALKRRLDNIPTGLHELFLDILTRDAKNLDELRLCLQIILFAKRPLRPDEFHAAITTVAESEDGEEELDASAPTTEVLRKLILDTSKGLAEVTKNKEATVQFIHESVRDFLLKEGGLDQLPIATKNFEGQSHQALTTRCLLQLKVWNRHTLLPGRDSPDPEKQQESTAWPFLEYAVEHVLHHANLTQRNGISQLQFIDSFPLKTWIHLNNRFEQSKSCQYEEDIELLYVLSEQGAESLIRIHPKKRRHFQMLGGHFHLPLLAACWNGQTAAARALVGLETFQESRAGPMELSPYNKRRGIVSVLIEHGDIGLLRRVLEGQDYRQSTFQPNNSDDLLGITPSEEFLDLLVRFSQDLQLFRDPLVSRLHMTYVNPSNDEEECDALWFVRQALKHDWILLGEQWSGRSFKGSGGKVSKLAKHSSSLTNKEIKRFGSQF